MLRVTNDAGSRLAELLERRGVAEDKALRLAAGVGGITFLFDRVQPGDRCFQHRDRVVLIVGERLFRALEDRTLVCKDGNDERQLVLRRREPE